MNHARLNAIATGIIATPLNLDKFNGPHEDFYKNMFAECLAGHPGTMDELQMLPNYLYLEKIM